MPEMDGLQTLTEIRKIYPTLPVIMFSTLTERGGVKTLEALALGATDYVTKPANVGSVSIAAQRIKDELIPKIKFFCANKLGGKTLPTVKPDKTFIPPPRKTLPRPKTPTLIQRVDIVAIGVSTGGPNALADLLPVFPESFSVPIVIVQHMPPYFTKLLAEQLTTKSNITIKEAVPGDVLKPGQAWIAPGDYHMILEKNESGVTVKTNQAPPENSCRPAVDVLFRSVAEIYGSNVLAIILTGMGQDGLIGCEYIKDGDGQVIVQDEESCVVWGMPGFVAKAGLADQILPLSQIGPETLNALKVGRRAPTIF
ncbi:MAG: chemotaxis-specific protein-glutamate methyltransferase CheB [Nitrospinaceae bacterium]